MAKDYPPTPNGSSTSLWAFLCYFFFRGLGMEAGFAAPALPFLSFSFLAIFPLSFGFWAKATQKAL